MPDLIQRLETTSNPDRALDWEIHCRDGIDGVGAYGAHPRYTKSIDAALTVVPDGLDFVLRSLRGNFEARVGGAKANFLIKDGYHQNGAIALCIAALKARKPPTS